MRIPQGNILASLSEQPETGSPSGLCKYSESAAQRGKRMYTVYYLL